MISKKKLYISAALFLFVSLIVLLPSKFLNETDGSLLEIAVSLRLQITGAIFGTGGVILAAIGWAIKEEE